MQSSAFQAWDNSHNCIEIECGRNDGKPFIVCAQSKNYMGMNILVFANDKDDAIQLIKSAFKKAMEIDYNENPKLRDYGFTQKSTRIKELLSLKWDVKSYNKKIASNVQWASNDGVLT